MIGFTKDYMTRDGKPWFPVMGEMHYSRVLPDTWEHELYLMKAGGVDVVSSYVIWIHHEEEEGKADFTGQNDLRRFVETAGRCGLSVIVRIGPWVHAEVRNGGFPDWLMEKEEAGLFRLRTNDAGYLAEVKRWYGLIGEQLTGLYEKDGGPVIGIQVENEYGHCGGLTGEEGEAHMRALKSLAEEAGMDVPLWTATGWGGAVTGGMLPVMGGYCEAPWAQTAEKLPPNENYVFTAERNDKAIGGDFGEGSGITFDPSAFPYLTAELGGGLQVTGHRRPVATAKDIAVMSLAKIGSGCQLLGYYMYHGGTNPVGKHSTFEESRATGSLNDLPALSYDFNAPLKEYGQISDTYRVIRRLALFVHDFGEDLVQMPYVPQPGNPEDPRDLLSLRTAARLRKTEDGRTEGYLFVNRYIRQYPTTSLSRKRLEVHDADGHLLVRFPERAVDNGDCFFYPIGMRLREDTVLEYAEAAPLCKLAGAGPDGGDAFVFYTDKEKKSGCSGGCGGGSCASCSARQAQFVLRGNRKDLRLIVLDADESLYASKVMIGGKEYLFVSTTGDDVYTGADGRLRLISRIKEDKMPAFFTFPALPEVPDGYVREDEKALSLLAHYRRGDALVNPLKAAVTGSQESAEGLTADILAEGVSSESLSKALLCIRYAGDRAVMTAEGKPVADSFYTGQVWETDLRQIPCGAGDVRNVRVAVQPLTKDTPVFLEQWPELTDGRACRVEDVWCEAVMEEVLL